MSDERPSISVIIASYNAAPWLVSTLDSIVEAASRTSWLIELVVVDDGSTDATAPLLAAYAADSPIPMRVVTQQNKGRFLSFHAAAEAAHGERVLLMGARMLLQPDAFEYLERVEPTLPAGQVWNGHVPNAPDGPLVSRFWEVPLHIFWGDYLADPKPTLITTENFDRVPKGTGALLIGRALFLEACEAVWPDGDAALISDDTKLLRFVVARQPMRLDPGYGAIYRPRVSVRSFLSHSFARGTLFVDSYAGTGLVRNLALVLLAFAPVVAVALLLVAVISGAWLLAGVVLGLVLVGIVVPVPVAVARKASGRAALSYLVYVVPFGAVFWAGLTRGLIVHRRAFTRTGSSTSS